VAATSSNATDRSVPATTKRPSAADVGFRRLQRLGGDAGALAMISLVARSPCRHAARDAMPAADRDPVGVACTSRMRSFGMRRSARISRKVVLPDGLRAGDQ
jgi:hypothetical protein